jgi:hypothetical protein
MPIVLSVQSCGIRKRKIAIGRGRHSGRAGALALKRGASQFIARRGMDRPWVKLLAPARSCAALSGAIVEAITASLPDSFRPLVRGRGLLQRDNLYHLQETEMRLLKRVSPRRAAARTE